jgi:DNA-binding MarR family transcriptional regulator
MSTPETAVTDESADRWEPIEELPPSAKLVAKVLEYTGTLSQRELAEETMLPARTVRYAITRLEEVDAVETQFSFTDARKRLYTLSI